MRSPNSSVLLACVCASAVWTPGAFAQAQRLADRVPRRDVSLLNEANHAIEIGCRWLCQAQLPDGSWCQYPGITGLAVAALAHSRLPKHGPQSPHVRKGVAYILKCVKPDGSICDKDLKSYNTSICVLALLATRDPKHHDVIRRARRFLMASQLDEESGCNAAHPHYGGIGYGKHERPDLSNLQWALEALRLSEFVERDRAAALVHDPALPKVTEQEAAGLCYERAIKFLERCQNRKESNDQAWAGTDGGFVYRPGESKAGEMRSYGSMTYAGLKSFIHAKLERDDPRVLAAYDWIRRHYTVDENPGMGARGLYYSYHTMAKALHVFGGETLIDAAGQKHRWRDELMAKLVSLQKGEGYWVNENGRWWENVKELATSYCLLALEILRG